MGNSTTYGGFKVKAKMIEGGEHGNIGEGKNVNFHYEKLMESFNSKL
jgi:hypothetical protein